MQLKAQYDLVIVGAGPAGSMLALELSRRCDRLNILLVDGSDPCRGKVCGGLLSPDAQRFLAARGLVLPKTVMADPQIFSVQVTDLTRGLRQSYQRHYINMDRAKFDNWLLSLLPSSVTVYKGRCSAVERLGQEGFSFALSGQHMRFTTGFMLSAQGADSSLRRQFFPERKLKQYTAIQEWYPRHEGAKPVYYCIFDEKTSDSCSWLLYKDNAVIYGGAFEKRHCRDAFRRQKTRFEALSGQTFPKAMKYEACLVSSPRRWRDFFCGQERLYFVGEAAGFISASSFEGFSNAFLSAAAFAEAFTTGERRDTAIGRRYRQLSFSLRLKLSVKAKKRWLLCQPLLRSWIMKSGLQAIRQEAYHLFELQPLKRGSR